MLQKVLDNRLLKVYIGSLNNDKICAIENTLKMYNNNIFLQALNVESNVSNQPFGIDETCLGAKNRVGNMKKLVSINPNEITIFIGIENGIILSSDSKIYDIPMTFIELYYNNHIEEFTSPFPKHLDSIDSIDSIDSQINTSSLYGAIDLTRFTCNGNALILNGNIYNFNKDETLESIFKSNVSTNESWHKYISGYSRRELIENSLGQIFTSLQRTLQNIYNYPTTSKWAFSKLVQG